MAATLPVNLSGADWVETGTAGHRSKGTYRVRFTDISRDEDTFVYKDYGLTGQTYGGSSGYFDGDFTHYITVELDEWAAGASNYGQAHFWWMGNDIDDEWYCYSNNKGYLTVCGAATATTITLNIGSKKNGSSGYSTDSWTVPIGFRYRPIFLKIWRDENLNTFNCTVYEDPARTRILDELSCALQDEVDYRYLGLLWTEDYNNASTCSGFSGELYLSTPPSYFTINESAIIWEPEDVDTFVGAVGDYPSDLDWTIVKPTGTTNELDSGWAHIASHDDENVLVYSSCSTTTTDHPVFMIGAEVKFAASQGNKFASTKYADIITAADLASSDEHYGIARVYNSSGTYYWRIIALSTADGAYASAQTYYTMTLDKTYEIILALSAITHVSAVSMCLYVRCAADTTNTSSTYKDWTLVDVATVSTGYYCGGWETMYIGNVYDMSGDMYIKNIKYLPYCTRFPSIARGGSNDSTIMASVTCAHSHTVSDKVQIFTSPDDGATWTYRYTFGPVAGENYFSGQLIWDDAYDTWYFFRNRSVIATGINYVQLYKCTDNVNFDDWSTCGSEIQDTDWRPSRRIVNGQIFGAGGDYVTYGESKCDGYFYKQELSGSYTRSECMIVHHHEGWFSTEGYVWRNSSGYLMTMIRTENTAHWNIMYQCLDTPYSDSEGMHNVTGTASTDSTNNLVDTTTNFVTAGVQVGWSIWNTTHTSGTVRGVVASITTTTNPNDTIHIHKADGTTDDLDLFDTGNEDYYISCWGIPQYPLPAESTGGDTEEYWYKTAWLRPFELSDFIWLQGANRRYNATPPSPASFASSLVAKASVDGAEIIAERTFNLCDPGGVIINYCGFETGNGDCDASNAAGNHYLDIIIDLGCAIFWRLDTVDTVSLMYKKYDGINFNKYMQWNGRDILTLSAIDGISTS